MKADLCPVCQGSGYKGYFGVTNRPFQGSGCYELCHGCGGQGWVAVPEGLPPYAPLPVWEESLPDQAIGCDPDICPVCGQHRSMPGLTGCPIGSHYGTFCATLSHGITYDSGDVTNNPDVQWTYT